MVWHTVCQPEQCKTKWGNKNLWQYLGKEHSLLVTEGILTLSKSVKIYKCFILINCGLYAIVEMCLEGSESACIFPVILIYCRLKRWSVCGERWPASSTHWCSQLKLSILSPDLTAQVIIWFFGSWYQWVRLGSLSMQHWVSVMTCWLESAARKVVAICFVLTLSHCHPQTDL